MVHLFRGGRGRGLPRPRAPVMMLRHMRPDFIPPHALPRGNLLNRPMRPGPMPLPRMLPPPLPPRPRPPPLRLPIRDMPYPPPIYPPPMRGLGIPPRVPPGPPLRGLIRSQPPIRGRGGFTKRGATVKRLVSSNGRAKKPQKRKEKTETFFCETCDRGWNTQEKLQEHVAQHQVCGRDGCTFTAHPKVVLKHTQVQHDSGLYYRITADIDKWIAERKSRFPTKENVEKKTAQINEMIKRGERMPTQGKRFQNKPNNENWRDKRQRTNTNYKSEVDKRQEKCEPRKLNRPCDNSQWRDPDAWRGDLPQFPGTAAFPLKDEDSSKDVEREEDISDDEEWADKPNAVIANEVSVQPSVSNILASLMVDYGSDMSDQDEESVTDLPKPQAQTPGFHAADKQVTKDVTVNIQIKEPSNTLENNEEHDNADSDSGPEESAIDHEDKSDIPVLNGRENKEQVLEQNTNPNAKEIYENKNKDRYKNVRTPMKRHQLSLLEKLLKNEIRHERNVILQCVRYVVKNNFLGSGNLPKNNAVGS